MIPSALPSLAAASAPAPEAGCLPVLPLLLRLQPAFVTLPPAVTIREVAALAGAALAEMTPALPALPLR